MASKIVNYYIEIENVPTARGGVDLNVLQARLEQVLRRAGCAFYDATAFDPYTRPESASEFPTLESIEADLECK